MTIFYWILFDCQQLGCIGVFNTKAQLAPQKKAKAQFVQYLNIFFKKKGPVGKHTRLQQY